jgi:hypothetical protein
MEIWEPKRPGTLWATPGLLLDPFTFNFYLNGAEVWEGAWPVNISGASGTKLTRTDTI